jgi:GMP synthase (glutamine-hydrolysing)
VGVTTRVLVVQHEDDDPIHLMGDWMEGVDLTSLRPYDGDDVPPTAEGYDGLVVMGGAMGAQDDEAAPWLPATRDLIRAAAADRVPTLGICLGHQLCAVALGGEVQKNPGGRQLGLLEVGWGAPAVDDPLLAPLVGPRRAMHWNDDVVTRLPNGAVQLATASTGEVQAARHGESVWGVQWHPEVDDALIRRWAMDGSLAPADQERLLDELVRSRGELDDAWRPLARSFSTLVRTASRVS